MNPSGALGLEPRPLSSTLDLPADRVHLWYASLDAPGAADLNLESSLSRDEKERAARFKFARDSMRFVVGRGLLRSLLGAYLDCEPRAVRFNCGPFGKPYLTDQTRSEPLSFNVSHCGGFALFAFARNRELGADVERMDRAIDVQEIAGQFFTAREVADISAQSIDRQTTRFLEFWTRKEALIKAVGQGLSIPLNHFDVSVENVPGYTYLLPECPLVRWSLRQFVPVPEYIAALAASGGPYQAEFREIVWFHESAGHNRAAPPGLYSVERAIFLN